MLNISFPCLTKAFDHTGTRSLLNEPKIQDTTKLGKEEQPLAAYIGFLLNSSPSRDGDLNLDKK